ncbi:hypothetical protein BpHYR1_010122 [Brachionus plicatilis]|uniref:Uncharacterized protein n=1 Tax=Brachionus plicatilis TaxID=10195 RepID=A0A3M7R9K5_BRAPC|nr:hypothetical protein BpHYR1_010122 [Brachionus plicatilis]
MAEGVLLLRAISNLNKQFKKKKLIVFHPNIIQKKNSNCTKHPSLVQKIALLIFNCFNKINESSYANLGKKKFIIVLQKNSKLCKNSAIFCKMHTIKKCLIKLCNKLQSFCRASNSLIALLEI